VNIKDKALLAKVLGPYSEGCVLPIGLKNSQGLALPKEIREKAYERIKTIALSFGVSIHICGCQNPDITAELCNITRVSNPVQLTLFESSSG